MTFSTTTIHVLSVLQFILLLNYNSVADAFCTSPRATRRHQLQPSISVISGFQISLSSSASRPRDISWRQSRTRTFLVSEEDVLEAVEQAEALWEKALEARTTANALIDRAEEEATASAGTAKEAENIFQNKTTPVTMEQLVQVDNAAKASLDATSLVNEAMKASDEADRLELEAEEALKKSEEKLDQHLIDYPDSALAD
eukprot:CAMPEP_0201126802 /NCGR_PEP_ID=MMETSP0850-20130426/27524_1 /ASSEMBLY_ACC=CAM_ASM_000622 /TAXON_ID=183588 /ORGANISM="Pseudo-nitzschia fraudulenta, Strain WWA7" /LENGTH=199 /DNA_ID=CAMNT_0047395387 /DNA_START=31 /DNA_END=630 /DNA_ORIENTATION=-